MKNKEKQLSEVNTSFSSISMSSILRKNMRVAEGKKEKRMTKDPINMSEPILSTKIESELKSIEEKKPHAPMHWWKSDSFTMDPWHSHLFETMLQNKK